MLGPGARADAAVVGGARTGGSATAYIEMFRGLPALLVLFLVGVGVPLAFPGPEIPGGTYGTVTLALGLTAAAYMAETIRAGIQAVPKGQMEAARIAGHVARAGPWSPSSSRRRSGS